MDIALVAHVPNEDILRGVQHIVQGDGEFGHSHGAFQVGDFIANARADLVHQIFGKRRKLRWF